MRARIPAYATKLALGLTAATAAFGGTFSDDFESYGAGTFPTANWQDTGPISPSSLQPPPNPSCSVELTTDTFGQQTRALHLDASWVGSASGIYRALPAVQRYVLRMDVRTDRFGAGATDDPSDWPWMMGVSRFDASEQAGGWHSLQMYGTNLSQDFRAYAIHDQGADDFPLGLSMLPGKWYTVQIDVDATTGAIRTNIWDTQSSVLLADALVMASAWSTADSVFDAVTINQGELSATSSSDTWVDNVSILAVPEPVSLTMLIVGVALAGRRSRD